MPGHEFIKPSNLVFGNAAEDICQPGLWIDALALEDLRLPIERRVAAQVMRVTETAHWLEWRDWADPILQRPYAIKDSLLHIPDVPGVGLDWDEAAVKANLVDL